MRRQRERRTAPQQRTPPRRARPERRLRTRERFCPGLLASSCYLISGELPEESHPEYTLKNRPEVQAPVGNLNLEQLQSIFHFLQAHSLSNAQHFNLFVIPGNSQ